VSFAGRRKTFPLQKKQFRGSFIAKKSESKIFNGNWWKEESRGISFLKDCPCKHKKEQPSKTGKLLFIIWF
jgi:hypothetical protein